MNGTKQLLEILLGAITFEGRILWRHDLDVWVQANMSIYIYSYIYICIYLFLYIRIYMYLHIWVRIDLERVLALT